MASEYLNRRVHRVRLSDHHDRPDSRRFSVQMCIRDSVIADSLLGEITPAMAAAIGQSRAQKILIPVNGLSLIHI